MAIEPKDTLKTYFETGDTPTAQQFANLIDSLYGYGDGRLIEGITTNPNTGSITITFTGGGTQVITQPQIEQIWANNGASISQNKPVGIGTNTPEAMLDILKATGDLLRLGRTETGDVLRVRNRIATGYNANEFHYGGYTGLAQYGFYKEKEGTFEIAGGVSQSGYNGSIFSIDRFGCVKSNVVAGNAFIINQNRFLTTNFAMQYAGNTKFRVTLTGGGLNSTSLWSVANMTIAPQGSFNATTNNVINLTSGLQTKLKARDFRFETNSVPNALNIHNNGDTNLGGSLIPKQVTQSQRLAIPLPTVGSIVYQTDATEGIYIYKSTGWALLN